MERDKLGHFIKGHISFNKDTAKILKKKCLVCKKEFVKSNNCSIKQWNKNKKYCSLKCYNKSKLGVLPWNTGKHIRLNTRGEFKKGQTPWNKGLRGFLSKEKHYNWKGGTTILQSQIRQCFKYRQWRSDVFTRDNYTCQKCDDNKGGNLEAHHIKKMCVILKEYNIKTIDDALYCEELWNINNGQTLCVNCHIKFHKKYV